MLHSCWLFLCHIFQKFLSPLGCLRQQTPAVLGTENDKLDELSLILVGTAGAGKSATGNTILRRKVFESRPSAVPVTRECQSGEGELGDRHLLVVDTPSFLSLTVPDKELLAEIKRYAQPSSGPHAILLVLQAGRFTVEEREAVQRIQHLFGKEALKFTVIVFTRREDLEGKTIESFVGESEKKLKELVRSCGGRVCAFNNRATGAEREQQVRRLMQVIDEMVAGNKLSNAGLIRRLWRVLCDFVNKFRDLPAVLGH
ncbi:GTPase IMAP family member 2-like [Lissotriton helveticus]